MKMKMKTKSLKNEIVKIIGIENIDKSIYTEKPTIYYNYNKKSCSIKFVLQDDVKIDVDKIKSLSKNIIKVVEKQYKYYPVGKGGYMVLLPGLKVVLNCKPGEIKF